MAVETLNSSYMGESRIDLSFLAAGAAAEVWTMRN